MHKKQIIIKKHQEIYRTKNIRLGIVAPSGSGKTYLLVNKILSNPKMPKFENIIVFTSTPFLPYWSNFVKKSHHYNTKNFKVINWSMEIFNLLYEAKEQEAMKYARSQEKGKIKDFTKHMPRLCIIFDDVKNDSEINKVLNDRIIYARNLNISIIYCVQYFTIIAKKIRQQLNYFYILGIGSREDLESMYRLLLLDINIQQFQELMKILTTDRDKWGVFVFNRNGKKNLIEYM